MTQEEKARAYDEALERARAMHDVNYTDSYTKANLEEIFPELRESEDERMTRVIRLALTDVPEERFTSLGTTLKDCLAYLEKQKEQNGEDEECTDFTIYHPLKNGKGKYECIPYSFYGSLTSFSEDKDLIDFLRTCFYTEEECNEWIDQQKERKPVISDEAIRDGVVHFGITQYQIDNWLKKHINIVEQKPAEWSIQDARPGDVLTTGEVTFILKSINGDFASVYCYFSEMTGKISFSETAEICSIYIHPATIEQRIRLYESLLRYIRICTTKRQEQKEPKPMEMDLNDRLEEISRNGLENAHTVDFSKEYENSKQILEKGTNCKEWSEEDEKELDCIINILDRLGFEEFCKSSRDQDIEEERFYYKEIQFLKRLKSIRPQPCEEIYQAAKHDLAIKFMNYLDENRPEGKMSLSNGECEDIDNAFKENDWARIMRYVEKYRSSWKPSKRQLTKLYCIAEGIPDDDDAKVLMEILEQLQKL